MRPSRRSVTNLQVMSEKEAKGTIQNRKKENRLRTGGKDRIIVIKVMCTIIALIVV